MHRILVIEDETDIALALSVRLTANGYEVLCEHDGMTGVQTAAHEQPDLIILDVGLAGGGGFVAAEWLRNSAITQEIPFVFLTGNQTPGLRERALDVGAAGFFEKPYEYQELLDAIRAILGLSDAETRAHD